MDARELEMENEYTKIVEIEKKMEAEQDAIDAEARKKDSESKK